MLWAPPTRGVGSPRSSCWFAGIFLQVRQTRLVGSTNSSCGFAQPLLWVRPTLVVGSPDTCCSFAGLVLHVRQVLVVDSACSCCGFAELVLYVCRGRHVGSPNSRVRFDSSCQFPTCFLEIRQTRRATSVGRSPPARAQTKARTRCLVFLAISQARSGAPMPRLNS